MDLSSLKPKSNVIEVILKHPGNGDTLVKPDGTEQSITVYAPHSKEYKKALYAQQNERLKKAQAGNKVEIDAEEIADIRIQLLADVTKSWDILIDGKCPKLTPAKARSLYEEIFWIPGQIEEEIEGYLGFMMG